jgi:outer membrane protein assembly factor BamB
VAVATVLAVVVGANVVEARRTAAEDARLAEVPGLVGSLEHPLEQVWTGSAVYSVAALGEVLVGQVMDGEEGPEGLEAIDVRTGSRLWSLATDRGAEGYRICSPWEDWRISLTEAGTATLLCVTEGGARPADAPAPIELVDVRTGEVLSAFELPATSLLSGRVGEDLVAAWVDDDRRVVVARVGTDDGAEQWRTTSEPLDPQIDPMTVSAHVYLEAVVVEQQSWEEEEAQAEHLLTVDPETGDVVDGPHGGWEGDLVAVAAPGLPGRRFVGYRDAAGTPGVRVEDADGAEVLDLDGWPLLPTVDDGAVPEVVLVRSPEGAVTAVDLGTGAERWSFGRGPAVAVVLRLAETVVVLDGSEAHALDLRTGAALWTVEDVAYAGAATDGRRVLLARIGDGGGLSAHDLRDGRELWRTALPGVQQITPGPGVVVLQRDGTIAGFR